LGHRARPTQIITVSFAARSSSDSRLSRCLGIEVAVVERLLRLRREPLDVQGPHEARLVELTEHHLSTGCDEALHSNAQLP
jgi:hypothetical protein